jgi:GAF domain-containing protein
MILSESRCPPIGQKLGLGLFVSGRDEGRRDMTWGQSRRRPGPVGEPTRPEAQLSSQLVGFTREAERHWLEHPPPVDRGSVTGRALLDGRPVHVSDVLTDSEYRVTRHTDLGGYRTVLAVPLLRDGKTIGVFALTRDEVKRPTRRLS